MPSCSVHTGKTSASEKLWPLIWNIKLIFRKVRFFAIQQSFKMSQQKWVPWALNFFILLWLRRSITQENTYSFGPELTWLFRQSHPRSRKELRMSLDPDRHSHLPNLVLSPETPTEPEGAEEAAGSRQTFTSSKTDLTTYVCPPCPEMTWLFRPSHPHIWWEAEQVAGSRPTFTSPRT